MPFTIPLGTVAPDFELPATDGKTYKLDDFTKGKGFVVFFTCNHCPYVIGSEEDTRTTVVKYRPLGIEFVAINSNTDTTYPEDSFEGMCARMANKKFPWVYLHDKTQEIAKKYGALRTPHFFFFNNQKKLIYTGRAVDSPRDPSRIKVHDLENALEDYLEGKKIRVPITNPIGCNVKWHNKEPHWMPEDACDLI